MNRVSTQGAYLSFILLLILFTGCAAPRLYIKSNEIQFKDTEIGSESKEEIVLKNNGNGKLKISSIDVSGQGYSYTNQIESIILSPNQSYTLDLDFIPGELGTSSGFVIINSNNPSDKLMNIKLQGRGIEPKFPVVDIETKSLDFQQVNIGDQSENSLTIHNSGTAYLTVSNITLLSEGFKLEQNIPANINIPPNNTRTIKITFSPSKQGHFSGVLSFTSNDPSSKIATISLVGEGINHLPPKIGLSANTLDFREVQVGKSISKQLIITNKGEESLEIKDIKISGQALRLKSNSCINRTIQPNGSCQMEIIFDPVNETDYSGQIEISSNDPNNSLKIVQLSGTGVKIIGVKIIKEQTPERSSANVNLGVFTHDDVKGTVVIKDGEMEKNAEISYSFSVQKFGDFEILLTPGYDLTRTDGFKFDKVVPFSDGGKYKRYIIEKVPVGSNFNVAIGRNERSPDKYRFVFKLFPR